MKKRTLTLLLAMVLLLGAVVGGTVAWLLDKTNPVVNTFTTSDLNIELKESENLDLQMVPGHKIAKDPVVTVKAGSEKCYVFVKVDKSANYSSFLKEYEMNSSWKAVPDTTGVYYMVVDEKAADQSFYVLAGTDDFTNGYVEVLPTVTKQNMNDLTQESYPTLTFTAYACQYYQTNGKEFTPEEAWKTVGN